MNIALKTGQSIKKTKKYYLIFKTTIESLKRRFLFIAFFNLYLIVSNCEIKLFKVFSSI